MYMLLDKGSVKCIPPFIARQWLGKPVPSRTNTRNNTKNGGRVGLCIPISFLGNNAVKTFPRQRRTVGGGVSCVARVISKESRRLVLPRTCFNCCRLSFIFVPDMYCTVP
jgi:hypothetical protein